MNEDRSWRSQVWGCFFALIAIAWLACLLLEIRNAI
jgi:hypothetical protein